MPSTRRIPTELPHLPLEPSHNLPAYVADPTDLISLAELCRRLEVQPRWVYEMRRRRRNNIPLPAVNAGRGHLHFSWTEVCLWLERRKKVYGRGS